MKDKNIHIDNLDKKLVFSIPDNFFAQQLERISKSIHPLQDLKEQYNQSYFKVPANYFNQLTEAIERKTTRKLTLNDIPKSSAFLVPDNYWNTNPLAIPLKANKKKELFDTFIFNDKSFNPFKVAAMAASIVISLFLGYYLIKPSPTNYLSHVTKEEVLNYLEERTGENKEAVFESLIGSSKEINRDDLLKKIKVHREDIDLEGVNVEVLEDVYLD